MATERPTVQEVVDELRASPAWPSLEVVGLLLDVAEKAHWLMNHPANLLPPAQRYMQPAQRRLLMEALDALRGTDA